MLIIKITLFTFVVNSFLGSNSACFERSRRAITRMSKRIVGVRRFRSHMSRVARVCGVRANSADLPRRCRARVHRSMFSNVMRSVILGRTASRLKVKMNPRRLFSVIRNRGVSPVVRRVRVFIGPRANTFSGATLLGFLGAVSSSGVTGCPTSRRTRLLRKHRF